MLSLRRLSMMLAALALPAVGRAHEGFLPLHHHSAAHSHADHDHATHVHTEADGKGVHLHEEPPAFDERFAFAVGGRYTRYSLGEGEHGHLWETGVGIDFSPVEWLHIGGDFSYGWYDSDDGGADGWMTPHAHLDFHIPLHHSWEVVVGLEVGFPGGDEALVGDHWEWTPHLELRYDPGLWYAELGAAVAFTVGGADHDHEHDHEGHEHGSSDDFHDIVDPHAKTELDYFGAAGLRLLDKKLTVEGRVSGVHILAGESPAENYVRAGLKVSYSFNEHVLFSVESSIPISDAERNEFQASAGLRLSF